MNTEEILYICTSCGIKENIPKEVVEYFDEMDQSNVNEHRHAFHAKSAEE